MPGKKSHQRRLRLSPFLSPRDVVENVLAATVVVVVVVDEVNAAVVVRRRRRRVVAVDVEKNTVEELLSVTIVDDREVVGVEEASVVVVDVETYDVVAAVVETTGPTKDGSVPK